MPGSKISAMAQTQTDELLTRVVSDPQILLGKPHIQGQRMAVAFTLECLAGMTRDELLRDYPALTEDDIEASLRYAARILNQERALR